jgi:hypothetical protein
MSKLVVNYKRDLILKARERIKIIFEKMDSCLIIEVARMNDSMRAQ